MVFLGGAVLANIVRVEKHYRLSQTTNNLSRWQATRACGYQRQSGRNRENAHWRNWAQDDVATERTNRSTTLTPCIIPNSARRTSIVRVQKQNSNQGTRKSIHRSAVIYSSRSPFARKQAATHGRVSLLCTQHVQTSFTQVTVIVIVKQTILS